MLYDFVFSYEDRHGKCKRTFDVKISEYARIDSYTRMLCANKGRQFTIDRFGMEVIIIVVDT